MSERFFVETEIVGASAVLTGHEAHHLTHVMRGHVGQQIVVFDGGGSEFLARIEQVGRREVALAIVEARHISREAAATIVLAVALPKGERQKWLVEKAVEVGVARLVPLRTSRSVADAGDKATERLARVVIEASKQCGRNRLMKIDPQVEFADLLSLAPLSACRLIAHPSGEAVASAIAHRTGETWLAVGPEGGFTDQEIAAAEHAGWASVTLGRRILRVETAAVALSSAIALLSERAP